MSTHLWRALVGRVVVVALCGLTLTGAAVADELAQPAHIASPAITQLRSAP